MLITPSLTLDTPGSFDNQVNYWIMKLWHFAWIEFTHCCGTHVSDVTHMQFALLENYAEMIEKKRILQVFIDLITNNFNKNSMSAYTKKISKTWRSANRAQFALPCYMDCRLCWGGSLFLPLFIRQVKNGDIVVIVWGTGGHEQFVPRTVDGHTLGALYTVFSRQQGLHFLSI